MESPPPRVNVRGMVSLFETQSLILDPKLKRAKSTGSIHHKPILRHPRSGQFNDLERIEDEIERIEEKLSNYRRYSKDSHIYYQTQLLGLLTDIVEVNSNDEIPVINKKRELIARIKKSSVDLNELLPEQHVNLVTMAKPFQRAVSEEVDTPAIIVTENDESSNGIPSVKKLRDLFERKQSENGLNSIVQERRTKLYSFSKSACDVSYVPYNEYIKTKQEEEEQEIPDYVVESNTLEDGIVHNPSLKSVNI